jgi:hypothetical protein
MKPLIAPTMDAKDIDFLSFKRFLGGVPCRKKRREAHTTSTAS